MEMHPDVFYFNILLSLMSHDFTSQGESGLRHAACSHITKICHSKSDVCESMFIFN